jgi:hypothetical protein
MLAAIADAHGSTGTACLPRQRRAQLPAERCHERSRGPGPTGAQLPSRPVCESDCAVMVGEQ